MRLLLPVILGALASASPLLPQRSVSKRAQSQLLAAYLTDWHSDPTSNPEYGIGNMTSSLYKWTDIIYAFAVLGANGIPTLTSNAVNVLQGVVQIAHSKEVRAHIAVGGRAGSQYFSTAFGSQDNRTQFIQAMENIVFNYSLQGVHIAWDYPNQQGIGCNIVSGSDLDNYYQFLQELRSTSFGQSSIISAAVPLKPWRDASGNPSTNLSNFASQLDFIVILAYDIWTPLNATVGPGAPLYDSCAPSGDQGGSVNSSVNAWMAAGFSADKIVVGTPAYGYLYNVPTSSALSTDGTLVQYPAIDKSKPSPPGDPWTATAGPDACGNQAPAAATIDLWGMIEKGYLNTTGDPQLGFYYRFDNCGRTPYVYNPTTGIEVAYENKDSYAAKGAYIAKQNLKGFAMWEAGGDSSDILLDAIRSGLVNGASGS